MVYLLILGFDKPCNPLWENLLQLACALMVTKGLVTHTNRCQPYLGIDATTLNALYIKGNWYLGLSGFGELISKMIKGLTCLLRLCMNCLVILILTINQGKLMCIISMRSYPP